MDFEIRDKRAAQGRGPLVRERAEYFRLMDQGFSSREACAMVGINYRTGKRWRNGHHASGKHKGTPAIRRSAAATSGPSRFLTAAERLHIADRRLEKAGIRTIARELGRSPSTISREIARNSTMGTRGKLSYRPHAAQARAEERKPRPKPRKLDQNGRLREFVQQHLDLRWSPEQICQALRKRFTDPADREMHVAHETIYQALYVQGRGQLRRELTRALRTGRARRKPRRQAQQRQARYTGCW